MKILLADDHELVRSGLRLLLNRLLSDVRIVEAGDYEEALRLCAEEDAYSLILVDRMMPGLANGDGLQALCQLAKGTPVVVLSASEDPTHIRAAMACGARGYLPKTMKEQVMFSALQLVLSGGTYLPVALLERFGDAGTEAPARAPAGTTLTPRQLDILDRIAVGRVNKEIAREFDISPATVQSHLNAIFRALSVTNRTEAVHVARQRGLLRDPSDTRFSADG
jgi:DNA-binding NarL/FixJ family response regulator